MNKILEIFPLLKALRDNLPSALSTDEYYVLEYHKLLDQVAQLFNENLDNFRVPKEEIYPEKHYHQADWETGQGGGYTYGPEKYCDRNKLLSKLDAFISYIETKVSLSLPKDQKSEMGFRTNKKKMED